jgi:hypothetical protein
LPSKTSSDLIKNLLTKMMEGGSLRILKNGNINSKNKSIYARNTVNSLWRARHNLAQARKQVNMFNEVFCGKLLPRVLAAQIN